MESETQKILVEGHNCWRIARVRRAAFLIDAASYYAAFAEAAEKAKKSILILGWDFNSRVCLIRDDRKRDLPTELGALLNTLVARRRGLHAYVLGWDFAMIYALEREPFPVFNLGWRTHRRFHFGLDEHHPVGASHHQKIVVVDDAIAFVGGLDLARARWDTSEHKAHDPRRVDPGGSPYPPSHDVQIAVDGEAAAALGDLVRERWRRATGQRIPAPSPRASDPWPAGLVPDVENIPVAIARTEPAYDGNPEVREVENLYLDAISHAQHSIYIENQYLTSSVIREALATRLREDEGPDIVIVVPEKTSGWLEESTMGVLRARLLKRLREADRFGRLRVYYSVVPELGNNFISFHSKVMVVDDRLLRIGSSNLNNRSMGLDTECDLAIESDGDASIKKVIARFRNRLLGEHLGVTPEKVAKVIAAEKSLAGATDVLCGGERTLKPLDGAVAEWLDQLVPDSAVVDPEHPTFEKLADDLVPKEDQVSKRWRFSKGGILLAILLGLAAAWRWTALADWVNVDSLSDWAMSFKGQPSAPLWILAAYLLGSLVMFPVTLLIVASVYAFGPMLGFTYSIIGSLLAAMLAYGIGLMLGQETIRKIGGSRLGRLRRRIARHGLLAMVTVHILPFGPFTVVNMVAGAARIRFRDFILGTFIGMLPGILSLTLFAHQLENVIGKPGMGSLAVLVGLVVSIAFAAIWIRRRIEKGNGISRGIRPRKKRTFTLRRAQPGV